VPAQSRPHGTRFRLRYGGRPAAGDLPWRRVVGLRRRGAADPLDPPERRMDKRIKPLANERRSDVNNPFGRNPQGKRLVSGIPRRHDTDVMPGFVETLREMPDSNRADRVRWGEPVGDQQHRQASAWKIRFRNRSNAVRFVHIVSQVGTSTLP